MYFLSLSLSLSLQIDLNVRRFTKQNARGEIHRGGFLEGSGFRDKHYAKLLLEVAIRRWVHGGHKGMDMVRNSSQVGRGIKRCPIGTKGPKVYQEYHHQPA